MDRNNLRIVDSFSRFLNGGVKMRKHKAYYRTKDGTADYQFMFEEIFEGCWHIYIESQPPYRGRDEDSHSTHRLPDGQRKYICWDGEIETLDEAKKVAALWSDKTQGYIKTGKKF
jgi:hypothetical protein